MLRKTQLALVAGTLLGLGTTLAWADNGIVVEQVPLTGPTPAVAPPVQTQAVPKASRIESAPLDSANAAGNTGGASGSGSSNSTWDLYQQVQQLQDQVQQMQGTIEEQGHTIERLRNDQKAQYTDLDQRINTLNDKVNQAPAGGASAATAPADSSAAAPVSNIEEEKNAYLTAYDVFRKQGPSQAIPPMLTFVSRYPNSTFAPNAYYWLGEFYLAANPVDLGSAQRNFETVLKQYPTNPKAPASLYKLGIIADQQGKPDIAKKRMQDVLTRFPNSPEAALANNYLNPPAPAPAPAAVQPKPKTHKKKPSNDD